LLNLKNLCAFKVQSSAFAEYVFFIQVVVLGGKFLFYLSRRSFRIGSAYMGAVVGAGFCTGQEIIQFFLMFGPEGLWGIILSAFLFSIFGAAVIYLAGCIGVRSYGEFTAALLGQKAGLIIDILITLFLTAGLCIMLTGSGALFAEHLGIEKNIGYFITAFLTAAAVLRGGEGVLRINSFLIPIMFFIILTASAASIAVGDHGILESAGPKRAGDFMFIKDWVASSFLYVSYNMIIAAVILSSLELKNTREDALGGIIGGIGLGILAFAVGAAVLKNWGLVFHYEIPMLCLAEKISPLFKYFLALALWISMYTTAVANSFGLIKRIESLSFIKGAEKGKVLGIAVIILTYPFSKIGFARLIGGIYPLFGWAGMPLLFEGF